jgi:hypothetical protein
MIIRSLILKLTAMVRRSPRETGCDKANSLNLFFRRLCRHDKWEWTNSGNENSN